MNISIIIPTIGRKRDLIKTLLSVEANNTKPIEVLIIDQGNIKPKMLKNFNLNLTLIKINKKSLTQAENIGVDLAVGDIISILDDDIILDKNYFKTILESFTKYDKVKIVQGKIVNYQSNKIMDFFYGLFLGPGSLKKSNYVRQFNFESMAYKSYSNTEEFCMWASGCNMNIKKDVFKYEKFDPQMLRPPTDEDVDFSFRVYKRFGPNSILLQPKAKLIHNTAPTGRLSNYNRILIKKIHKIYLSYKNGRRRGLKEFLKEVWYNFGCLSFYALRMCRGDYKSFFYFLAVQYQILLHRRDIKNLDIEWMNLKLFNEKSTPVAKIVKKIKL